MPEQAPRAEAPLATDRTAGEVSVNPSPPFSRAITSAIRPRPTVRRSLLRWPIAIIAMLVAAGLGAVFLVMESRRPPSSPAKTLLKPPEAQITPAAIAALGRSSDLGGSLVQADEWRQILHKLGTTPDDPRFAKLDDAVATLRLRLRPQPAPETAAVTAFRAQDRSLGEAIRKLPPHVRYDSPELVPARKAMTAADSLLETHAAELEPFAGTYRLVRVDFERFLAQLDRAKPIETLLDQARREIESGPPTRAMETFARIRLVELRTSLTNSQRADLDERFSALFEGSLNLAIARRTLDEATKARISGDSRARTQLIRQARARLDMASAHISKSQLDPLLIAIESEQSGTIASRRASVPDRLDRDKYEAALGRFATWRLTDTKTWGVECANLHKLAKELLADHADWAATLADLAIEGLRARLDALKESDQEVEATRSELRTILDGLELWKTRPGWLSLDADLRRREK